MDLVKDELENGDDKLSDWIRGIDKTLIIDRINTNIFEKYTAIINYIKTCRLYKEQALKEWSDIKVADPWLVATAEVYRYTVVTFEKPNENLSTYTQGRHVKIPDICKQFGVKCENLYYMMKALSFKI